MKALYGIVPLTAGMIGTILLLVVVNLYGIETSSLSYVALEETATISEVHKDGHRCHGQLDSYGGSNITGNDPKVYIESNAWPARQLRPSGIPAMWPTSRSREASRPHPVSTGSGQ